MSGSIVFMEDGLWENWFPEYEVCNLGVSGDTTDDLIARLDTVIEVHADVVVLQVGTNDLGWRKSDEYITRNVETILCILRKELPQTRIVVQSVLPRERGVALIIRSINRHICQFAPTQRAQYLDLWPVLAELDGELSRQYSNDYVHLTFEGYEVWVTALKPAIELLFGRPSSTWPNAIQRA